VLGLSLFFMGQASSPNSSDFIQIVAALVLHLQVILSKFLEPYPPPFPPLP
jgi:hypothetical protein